MPRPRKYANNAEKAKAFRLRRKIEENQHPPELDQVAKMVHKLYKERGERGLIDPEKFVGKTPFETLLRVVVYDLLFKRHLPDNAAYDYPPIHTLIRPAQGSSPDLPSWIISPNNIPEAAAAYVSVLVDEEDEEDEEDSSA
jgi:hypothetical protein